MNQPNNPATDRFVVQVDPEIEEIVPIFLQNRLNDIDSIVIALRQGDFETIRILGHGMRGAGGGYGFDGITDIGQFLEQAAKEQNSEMVRKQVECLADYLERVEVVCE